MGVGVEGWGEVVAAAGVGRCSVGTPGMGQSQAGRRTGTFWVFIHVGDIVPHVGSDGLCDDECANGLLLYIHDLEAAIVLSLPVNFVTVDLSEEGSGGGDEPGWSKPEGLRVGLTPSCREGWIQRSGTSLHSRTGRLSKLSQTKAETRSWEAPCSTFGINNSNPLGSSTGFMTYKAVSYSLFLLILSTGSTAAMIITLSQWRKPRL